MFCKKCGREIPDDSAFCPKCGANTTGANTTGASNTAALPKISLQKSDYMMIIAVILAVFPVIVSLSIFSLLLEAAAIVICIKVLFENKKEPCFPSFLPLLWRFSALSEQCAA